MKGIVFTEFLDMIDQTFSPDLCEEMVLSCDLPSGGAYTSVGTYDHKELITMVVQLSKMTNIEVPDLVHAFGQHLFRVFVKDFPIEIDMAEELFAFLDSVENVIHVEVRKLYPDASIPSLICHAVGPDSLQVDYKSRCPFSTLAEGLITESSKHFKTPIELKILSKSEAGDEASFLVKKIPVDA